MAHFGAARSRGGGVDSGGVDSGAAAAAGAAPRRGCPPPLRHLPAPRRRLIVAQAGSDGDGGGDWVAASAGALRAVPLVAGAAGIAGVVANRVASGIAPVASAGSAQSRADVLVIVLSAALVLTGVQWLSLRPRVPPRVELDGEDAAFLDPRLPPAAAEELRWAGAAVAAAARATTLAVFHRGRCVALLGRAAAGCRPADAAPGPLCRQAAASGAGNYLANLALFPGRAEFAGYLPARTQAAIVQPVGGAGALVAGTNAQRGFTQLDQAWIASLADKLELVFEQHPPAGSGFSKKNA